MAIVTQMYCIKHDAVYSLHAVRQILPYNVVFMTDALFVIKVMFLMRL